MYFLQAFDEFNYDENENRPERCARQDEIDVICGQLPGQLDRRAGQELGLLCTVNQLGYSAAYQRAYSDPCSQKVRNLRHPVETCQYGRGCGISLELEDALGQCASNCAADAPPLRPEEGGQQEEGAAACRPPGGV